MAKKKDKPQVVNNIQELNLEIDYDKLAEAMVRAQNKTETIGDNLDNKQKNTWKSIWNIIINKKENQSDFAVASMWALMTVLFNAMAIILSICCFICLYLTLKNIVDTILSNELGIALVVKILKCVMYLSVSSTCFISAVLMRGIANDIYRQRNRSYIISVFSGIVSFAALIVALVALFKGVG